MITLALDTATDRCTVAAGDGDRIASAFVDGSRKHAAAIIGLIEQVLHDIGGTAADIGCVAVGDGPGSFTGLRVAASVAKALAWQRNVEWRVAPSLLVRAAAYTPSGGGVVLALSDALRGELYAGCWRITPLLVERLGPAPRAVEPEALSDWGPIDIVVGSIPAVLIDRVRDATGCDPIAGEASLPDARALLSLVRTAGATTRIVDPAAWQPEYGRPVEAQAAWERAHGMELPAAPRVAR